MIKSLLILLLVLALAAAAFVTRPSPASFRQKIRQDIAATSDGFLEKISIDMRTDGYMDKVEIRDRLLWVDVVRGDQVVYTGAFSHWFKRSESR